MAGTGESGFKETFQSMVSKLDETLTNPKYANINSKDVIERYRCGSQWIKDIDGPSMFFIESTSIAKLGYIPVHREAMDKGLLLTIDQALKKYPSRDGPLRETCFLSHNWCMGPDHSKIDDHDFSKAKMCVLFAHWFNLVNRGNDPSKHQPQLWWIDWCCLDQENPAPGAAMLPAFIKMSGLILCFVHDVKYFTRAWCRTERVLFASLCSPRNWMYQLKKPPGSNDAFLVHLDDPLKGDLTFEADQTYISQLTEMATYFYAKNYDQEFDGTNKYKSDKAHWSFVLPELVFGSNGNSTTQVMAHTCDTQASKRSRLSKLRGQVCCWDFTSAGFIGPLSRIRVQPDGSFQAVR